MESHNLRIDQGSYSVNNKLLLENKSVKIQYTPVMYLLPKFLGQLLYDNGKLGVGLELTIAP